MQATLTGGVALWQVQGAPPPLTAWTWPSWAIAALGAVSVLVGTGYYALVLRRRLSRLP